MKHSIRKFLTSLLLVLIVCPVNAAKSNDTNPQQYSMAELNTKLSKLILDKYPSSRVDVSRYACSACNAAFNEDSAIQQQPCSDYRVKPRPDSAEFKFNLFVQFDGTHYRPIKDYDEVSNNPLTTLKKRYNIEILSDPQKPSHSQKIDYQSEVSLAPPFDWPYRDWDQLVQTGVTTEPMLHCMGSCKPATRYEFAVGVARLLDQKEKRAKDSSEVKVLIAKLAIEFEPELSQLGLHIDHNQLIKELAKEGIVWHPRYMYLQLNLSYGKNFDEKLRKKMEHVIEKYASAWLKSNSSANASAASK